MLTWGGTAVLLKLWLSEDQSITLHHRREINQLRDTMLANQTEMRTVIDNIIQTSKSPFVKALR